MKFFFNGNAIPTKYELFNALDEEIKNDSKFDLDNLRAGKIYSINVKPQHVPKEFSPWALYLAFQAGGASFQIGIDVQGQIAVRQYSGANPTWSAWRIVTTKISGGVARVLYRRYFQRLEVA